MKMSSCCVLLLLCGSLSLYGMEVDDAFSRSLLDVLSLEIEEKILDGAHDPMPIADGVQDVREYKHGDVRWVLWSPNSRYIANDCREQVIIEPYLGGKSVSLPGWHLAMPLRGETVWSPDSSLIALSSEPFLDSGDRHKIAIYTYAGEKRYEIAGGDRRVHWLSDGRLLTYKGNDIQVHSPRGEQDFRSDFDESILLNLWSGGSSVVNDPEDDQKVCMYGSGGKVCAEWKKDRELPLPDMLKFIRLSDSGDTEKTHKIYTVSHDGRHIESTVCEGVDMVQWSPDGTTLVRRLLEDDCSKIQLCTDKGIPYAEWEGDSFSWLPCGRLVYSSI